MWLQIAALWAVAVAQPLFDLLGANPEFFIAHRAGAADILVLTLALAFVPPVLLAMGVRLVGLAGPRAAAAARSIMVAALVCILAMQLAVRAGAATWIVAVPISVAVAAAVTLAHARWAPVGSFLSILSIAAPIVPVLFLAQPGIRSLVAGELNRSGSAEVTAAPGASAAAPVVLVVFDELPLLSLLDASHNIDPVRYPNFAALAHDGVWFRNGTTVNDFTRWAVPSIVSGKYPRHAALPSAVDHPNTLFTLLSRTHRLEVSEALTSLCPRRLCPLGEEASLSRRLAAMGRDLRVVLLHLVLTEDLTVGLPDPTQTWAGFDKGGPESPENADAQPRAANPDDVAPPVEGVRRRWREGITSPRVTPVMEFIEGIGKDDAQPTFYFLHTLVSHHPHDLLPDGRENGTQVGLPGRVGGTWGKDQPWAVAQHYQRHLLVAGFVDRLVGQLTTRLKDAGLYDRAVIVITADHGFAHTPGAPFRNFDGQNAAEIMRVPIIVKFPDHIGVLPSVSDVNAETIDILPTIADALDIEVPWPIDGTSLVDPARPERSSKALFSGSDGRRFEVAADGPETEPALRRKLDLFGDGAGNAQRAPRLPALEGLLGLPIAGLRIVDGGGPVEIASAWEYEDVDPAAPAVVFDVAGRFASPRPDAFVAVAVNGVVEAVTRTWESNPRGWLATPRFDVWRRGRNAIDVFVVERDEAGLLLRRTSLAQVRPADLNLISAAADSDWGVRQWGFYQIERRGDGTQFRWTRDRAELSNLFTHSPPHEVLIEVLTVPGSAPKTLKIEANDCLLFEGTVGDRWSSTLPLGRCDLSRDGLTLRFTTDAPRGARDRRRLGVAVSRVVLR